MMRENNNSRERIDWISLAVALLISTNYIYFLGTALSIPSSGTIASIASFVCLLIGILTMPTKLNTKYPILMVGVIIWCVLYTFFVAEERTSFTFISFAAFCFFPLLIGAFSFDEEKVVRYTCYMTPTVIISSGVIFRTQGAYEQIEMGASYGMITLVLATLIHFSFYRKKAGAYMKICYIIGAYVLYMMLFYSTRGSVLTCLIAIGIVIFTKYDENDNYVKKSLKTKVIMFIITILVAFIYINFDNVVIGLSNFLENIFGDLPAALKKTLSAVDTGDVSHGRNELAQFTFDKISENPLWGHGILTFKSYSAYEYPHNCVLQLLFESGIVGSIYQISSIIFGIIYILFKPSKIEKGRRIYYLFVFLSAFPMLFLSSQMWIIPAFWISVMIGAQLLNENIAKPLKIRQRTIAKTESDS